MSSVMTDTKEDSNKSRCPNRHLHHSSPMECRVEHTPAEKEQRNKKRNNKCDFNSTCKKHSDFNSTCKKHNDTSFDESIHDSPLFKSAEEARSLISLVREMLHSSPQIEPAIQLEGTDLDYQDLEAMGSFMLDSAPDRPIENSFYSFRDFDGQKKSNSSCNPVHYSQERRDRYRHQPQQYHGMTPFRRMDRRFTLAPTPTSRCINPNFLFVDAPTVQFNRDRAFLCDDSSTLAFDESQ